ncbi:MAG: hypothetical protein KJ597_06960 [Nanoarchaeota archaeon]|nr:hypothetical protein [Nanoarchaeota archaeon]MBU1623287.1 hypothetical protein [Nanoarchaeota archaeon]
MVKKCIICSEEATHKIKDTSDYYCEECAKENFSDLDLLVTVEDEARKLKQILKEKMEELEKEVDEVSEKCIKQSESEN